MFSWEGVNFIVLDRSTLYEQPEQMFMISIELKLREKY
jgi:hypothetical protein